MISPCRHIAPDSLAVDALNLIQQYAITVLPVLKKQKVVGIIHMHDLLKAGIA